MKRILLGLALLTAAWAATAQAAPTVEAKCQAVKNKEAGKYAACLQAAEQRLVSTLGACSGDAADCYRDGECTGVQTCDKDRTRYDAAVLKCDTRFSDKWAAAENDATSKGGVCPDGKPDPNTWISFIGAHSSAVATALGGGGLMSDVEACNNNLSACQSARIAAEQCGNGVIDAAEQCDPAAPLDCQTLTAGAEPYGTASCSATCGADTTQCRTFARVFLTPPLTGFLANPGQALAVADGHCRSWAEANSLDGNWAAWLSTTTTSAKDRVGNGPWYLVDNVTKVADTLTDLIDGTIDAPINMYPNGAVFVSGTILPRVWTGTSSIGTTTGLTCGDWTNAGAAAWFGDLTSATGWWTQASTQACSAYAGLYCFEIP